MTPAQFTRALSATRMSPEGRTAQAVRLVLVDGLTSYAAAQRIGLHESAVSRAVRKLQPPERVPCPHCQGTGYAAG